MVTLTTTLRGRVVGMAALATVMVISGARSATAQGQPSNVQPLLNDAEEIRKLKEGFKERLGDVELKVEEKNGALLYTYKYVPPKPDPQNQARGYSSLEIKYVKKAWTGLQTILLEYCKFKKNNQNYGKEIFQKERPADLFTRGQADETTPCSGSALRACARDASAPDITLSVQFVDQVMRLMIASRDFSDQNFQCDSIFDVNGQNMPDSPEMPQQQTFDNCEGQGAKHCFRNKVLYNAVRIIALSKTLHTAKFDISLLQGLDTKMHDQAGLETLVHGALDGVNVDTALEENREIWVQFSNWLSKLAQGQAAGSVYRPVVSSSGSNN